MTKPDKKPHSAITRESLRLFEPISSLSNERLDELVSLAYVESVNVGVSIFREGDVDNETIYVLKGDVQLRSSTSSTETMVRSNSKEGRFPLDDSQPRQYSAVAMSTVEIVRIDNSVLDYMMMWDQLAVAELSETTNPESKSKTGEVVDNAVEKLVEQAVLDSIDDAKGQDNSNNTGTTKADFTKTIKPELNPANAVKKPQQQSTDSQQFKNTADDSQNKNNLNSVTTVNDALKSKNNKNKSEPVDINKTKSTNPESKKEKKYDNQNQKKSNDDKWKKKTDIGSNSQTTVNEAININDKKSKDSKQDQNQIKVDEKDNQADKNKIDSKASISDTKLEDKKSVAPAVDKKVKVNGENTIVYESRDWIRKIRQIMAFKNMPPANIKNLLEKMESVKVSKGDKIIEQGGVGDYYYVITDGTAVVTRTIELASLTAGTSFGEEALVAKSPRNASVSMTSDGILMRLSKKDFDELLIEPLMDRVSAEEARSKVLQGAKWLDVRHAKEFHHSRLPGAINIPLHELRLRMAELDKDAEYICCCRTGARSSSGSFLLAQNGFKVSLLNGGIQVMSQDLRR